MTNVNMNQKTGVRYGVTCPNSFPEFAKDYDWFEDFEPVYFDENGNETEDVDCEIDFFVETTCYRMDKNGIKAEYNSNSNIIMVFESPYTAYCELCSPCYPNAGNLDEITETRYGYQTYSLFNMAESYEIEDVICINHGSMPHLKNLSLKVIEVLPDKIKVECFGNKRFSIAGDDTNIETLSKEYVVRNWEVLKHEFIEYIKESRPEFVQADSDSVLNSKGYVFNHYIFMEWLKTLKLSTKFDFSKLADCSLNYKASELCNLSGESTPLQFTLDVNCLTPHIVKAGTIKKELVA